jgi:pimeloyl-ACP methyl ester carboxylesterase
MAALQANGWGRGGVLPWMPTQKQFANTVYQVELPSTAPITVQAQTLLPVMRQVAKQHPDEKLILVGHSAGGIVARMALVHQDAPKVNTLVTIAAPHLGTVRAEQALGLANIGFPFSLPLDVLGGEDYEALKYSRGLLLDLIRPRPGSLLGWLNVQPHPAIRYVSVVRGNAVAMGGDMLVPAYSQDMNRVPALQGRAELVAVPADHGLTPLDAQALLAVLR